MDVNSVRYTKILKVLLEYTKMWSYNSVENSIKKGEKSDKSDKY